MNSKTRVDKLEKARGESAPEGVPARWVAVEQDNGSILWAGEVYPDRAALQTRLRELDEIWPGDEVLVILDNPFLRESGPHMEGMARPAHNSMLGEAGITRRGRHGLPGYERR